MSNIILNDFYKLTIRQYPYPAQWQIIKEMDIKAYNKFRADYSIAELEDRFKKELRYEQITL